MCGGARAERTLRSHYNARTALGYFHGSMHRATHTAAAAIRVYRILVAVTVSITGSGSDGAVEGACSIHSASESTVAAAAAVAIAVIIVIIASSVVSEVTVHSSSGSRVDIHCAAVHASLTAACR